MSYGPGYGSGYGPGYARAGAPQTTVPDVVGQSEASATAELEGAGFVVEVISGYSATVPLGDVASQAPAAGASADEGSTVTITVSLGPAGAVVSRTRSRFGFGVGMG